MFSLCKISQYTSVLGIYCWNLWTVAKGQVLALIQRLAFFKKCTLRSWFVPLCFGCCREWVLFRGSLFRGSKEQACIPQISVLCTNLSDCHSAFYGGCSIATCNWYDLGFRLDSARASFLLLPQVEVLRSKVSSLEGDLRSSTSVNSQLQDQMVQERRTKDKLIRELEGEKEDLTSQVSQDDKWNWRVQSISWRVSVPTTYVVWPVLRHLVCRVNDEFVGAESAITNYLRFCIIMQCCVEKSC